MHQFLAANINLIIIFFIYVHLLTCGSFFFSDEWIHTTGMDDASLTSQYPPLLPYHYPATPPRPTCRYASPCSGCVACIPDRSNRLPRKRTQ